MRIEKVSLKHTYPVLVRLSIWETLRCTREICRTQTLPRAVWTIE